MRQTNLLRVIMSELIIGRSDGAPSQEPAEPSPNQKLENCPTTHPRLTK